MTRTRFGYVYETLTCPACNHDLTVPKGVDVNCVSNEGVVLGNFPDRLLKVAENVGVLEDQEGLVEVGKHGSTSCGACGEELIDYENGFTWVRDVDRQPARDQAVADARLRSIEGPLSRIVQETAPKIEDQPSLEDFLQAKLDPDRVLYQCDEVEEMIRAAWYRRLS
jgi:hypothetical protein